MLLKYQKAGSNHMKVEWEELSNNTQTIEDKCSTFYPQFESIKKYFLKYFDEENDCINFDYFIPSIQKELNIMNRYILQNIFYDNDYNWNESDMYDWVIKCFFKIETSKGIRKGYIIQLYWKDSFQKYFCATCKKTLANIIKLKLKYIHAKKKK